GDKPADMTSFLPFLDTGQSPLGHGQEVVYTIHYRNRGADTASGVYADVSAHYSLRLAGGDHQVVPLGDIGPGVEGITTFTAIVDLTKGLQDYQNCLLSKPDYLCTDYLRLAGIEALIYDDAHGPSGPPLEWMWVDHKVDYSPPEFFGVQQPEYVIAAGLNTLRGYAYDDSGVSAMTMMIDGASPLTCPDATPRDGQWSCDWDTSTALSAGVTGASNGDTFQVSLQATDAFGRPSALSNPQPFVVDTLPPVVTLDETASTVTPGSVVRGGTYRLVGQAVDNLGLSRVEACVDGRCALAGLNLLDAATAHVYDDVPATPIAINDTTSCANPVVRAFTVAENFAIGQVSLGFNAEHTYRDDIQVELQSPTGIRVRLLYNDGLAATNFANYDLLLNDAAVSPYNTRRDDNPSVPYYDRQARPYKPLSVFKGQMSQGTWTLTICDLEPSANDGAYNRSRLVLKPQSTAARSGEWSYRVSIPDREDHVQHTLSVYGVDLVGNRTEPPLDVSFIVDNVAPVITVNEVVSQVWWGRTETILSGTVSDGGQVSAAFVYIQDPTGRIYSEMVTREGDTWRYDLRAWLAGRYTLGVIVGDLAGNVSTAGPFAVDATCIAAELSAALVTAEPAAGTPFSVTLTAVVSNTGSVEIPAGLPVGFYVGDMRIGAAATIQALGPGQSETIVVIWEESYRGDHAIRIVPNDVETDISPLPVCGMQATAHQSISILDVPLVDSWNLMSAYVNPFNTDTSVVQRPIAGQYVVIQGFDGGAQSYYPDLPPELNTLKEMDAEHGYWIKTVISDQLPALSPVEGSVISDQSATAEDEEGEEAVAVLQVVGERFAEDRPIELDAVWNLVSYLPCQPLAVADALQSIEGQYTAVLGYDQGALSYYPDIDPSFNTLHEMEPLFGYWIRMTQGGTLQYPTTGDQILDIGY
ncbi:MAG: proprotein convertase P-domain-containing protein, partial [Syntrophaceae bacterium]|nr:proprotein convertase P-domain-containing protein [Syntrophaceae bacterium]